MADEGEGVLTRTMRVLECFTDDEPALSAARIGELTGLASAPPCTGCSPS